METDVGSAAQWHGTDSAVRLRRWTGSTRGWPGGGPTRSRAAATVWRRRRRAAGYLV